MSNKSTNPRAINDPWLTAPEVGRELKLTPRWVKKLINDGVFGTIGDGTTDTPVKRVPYKGGIGGFVFYVRRSALDSHVVQKLEARESARA